MSRIVGQRYPRHVQHSGTAAPEWPHRQERLQHVHGHLAAVLQVLRQLHGCHAAGTEFTQNGVAIGKCSSEAFTQCLRRIRQVGRAVKLAVDGISTRILGQTAFTCFRGGRLRLARREPRRNAMTSTPLPSAPTLRWLVAAAMLALAAHELHEIVHTWTGRTLCGAWGTRDFNVWSLAPGCSTWVPTLVGPVFSCALMWVGVALLSSPDVRKRWVGLATLFAPNPLGRLLPAVLGGGDEGVVARAAASSSRGRCSSSWATDCSRAVCSRVKARSERRCWSSSSRRRRWWAVC